MWTRLRVRRMVSNSMQTPRAIVPIVATRPSMADDGRRKAFYCLRRIAPSGRSDAEGTNFRMSPVQVLRVVRKVADHVC
jgi:hypothetical protein